jgi:hypothetical protein
VAGATALLRRWVQRLRRRAQHEGIAVSAARALGPVATAVALVLAVGPVFQPFLRGDPSQWPAGASALALRLGLLVAGWGALEGHEAVLRGGDRRVLSALPVNPVAVVRYELTRRLLARAWVVVALCAVAAPLIRAGAAGLGVAVAAVAVTAWSLGVPAGAAGALLAVRAAQDPRFAPALDLVRGTNPRPQAALIWAPGLTLGAVGTLVAFAARAPDAGAALVALPVAGAAAAWAALPGLARRGWWSAGAVLAEVDGRYAAAGAAPGLERAVYLDWAVRFLPVGWRPWALTDLRQGWRARRSLLSGAWFGGALAFAAGWSPDAAAWSAAIVVGGLAAWSCGAIGPLLDRDLPPAAVLWVPSGGLARGGARWAALVAWLQPCAGLPALALSLRHGLGAGIGAALALEAVILVVAGWGAAARPARFGLTGYMLGGLVGAAGLARWGVG